MPDKRLPEFTGSAAKLPEDLRKALALELAKVFAELMPERTVEAITASRSFSGYSADNWKRVVLGVEVRFADGFETHIVKLGKADEVRPDFTGWDACTRGRQVASRIFAPVRPVELPNGRYAVLYQDAYTLYGRASEDDRPRSLEDVARWAVNDAKPDPLSVERAMAHIYTDLARWFYEPVADRAAAVAFYRKRLGFGEEEAGKRALERWDLDDRPALRRDAVWVLCGRDKPDADAGTARYLDPVEFVAWALNGSDPEWPPETLVGPAHGDLHARNVLLGVCRGEAEYPAVFDYGAMGTANVLAWDFAKLEGELTRVLLPPLLENPEVLEELAGKSKLRPVPPKEPGVPTEAAERADRLRAFLRFQELLHDLTARVQTQSGAESIRPLAHPPTGLVAVDRLLAILLRVRKEAALCLGFNRPSRQGRWRDEYFFALAVQGLLNAKAKWDYSPHQQECALVASGVALAKSPKAAELLQAAAEAGAAAKEPFPSYRVPLAVIYRLWSDKKHADAAEFAARVAVGLSEPKPGKGSEPVVRTAARHAVPLQTAAVLAHMEVGKGGPFEHLLNEKVRKQAREFGDFETLARLGRLLKDLGDQKWAASRIEFRFLRDDPAWQHYLNAQEVYAEAYKATDDYYVGINAATLAFLTHKTEVACELSEKVAKACEGLHNADLKDRYWVFATEGEAALVRGRPMAGKIPDAAHFYAAALAALTPGQGAWADSSYRQLCRLWLALGEERVGPLLRLFEAHEIASPALTRGFMGCPAAP